MEAEQTLLASVGQRAHLMPFVGPCLAYQGSVLDAGGGVPLAPQKKNIKCDPAELFEAGVLVQYDSHLVFEHKFLLLEAFQ